MTFKEDSALIERWISKRPKSQPRGRPVTKGRTPRLEELLKIGQRGIDEKRRDPFLSQYEADTLRQRFSTTPHRPFTEIRPMGEYLHEKDVSANCKRYTSKLAAFVRALELGHYATPIPDNDNAGIDDTFSAEPYAIHPKFRAVFAALLRAFDRSHGVGLYGESNAASIHKRLQNPVVGRARSGVGVMGLIKPNMSHPISDGSPRSARPRFGEDIAIHAKVMTHLDPYTSNLLDIALNDGDMDGKLFTKALATSSKVGHERAVINFTHLVVEAYRRVAYSIRYVGTTQLAA